MVNRRVVEIASRLQKQFLGPASTNDVSIFLCGGAAAEKQDLRRQLGTSLAGLRSKYRYSVFYPEDMFVELVLGHQKEDLLSLENLLAKSVSTVVILLQSPGTFTELGAFSNHDLLKEKLVVVVDPKYRNSQSFINTGPIRHLLRGTTSRVLFLKMDEPNLGELVKHVAEASRSVASAHPPTRDLTNPIMCYELYLAMLYVLDPVPRKAFALIAAALRPDAEEDAQIAAETVVNGLINKGDALLVSENVVISRKGVKSLLASPVSARRLASLKEFLSALRIYALNGQLRRRYKAFWGEAA
jgi:hypothetical protein